MGTIVGIIIVTAIVVGLLFVIREIVCWYFKINERIDLQKETNKLLIKIIEKDK